MSGPEYKDYYKILGVAEDRDRQGDQGRLPEARAQAPSRRQQERARPRRASRRSTRPTRSCPIPPSASATTQLGSDWDPSYRPGPGGAGRGGPAGGAWTPSASAARTWAASPTSSAPSSAAGAAAGAEAACGGPRRRRVRGGLRPAAGRARTRQDVETPVELTLEEVLRGTTRTRADGRKARAAARVEVKIPPGVRDGSRVRVAGEGGRGARRSARRPVHARHDLPHPAVRAEGRRPAGAVHGAPHDGRPGRRSAGPDPRRAGGDQGPARDSRRAGVPAAQHGLPRARGRRRAGRPPGVAGRRPARERWGTARRSSSRS